MAYEVVVEHLNHLGIVAEVCRGDRSRRVAQRPGSHLTPAGKRGHGDGGDGAQWVGLQQSAALSGAAVLRG